MQKKYLLLRSNKQSGPYNLNELIQVKLNPLDLIWIEGKSKSWCHPEEMEALKSHVNNDKKAVDSVSYPRDNNQLVCPGISLNNEPGKNPEELHVQVYVKLPDNYNAANPVKEMMPAAGDELNETNETSLKIKFTRNLDEVKAEYAEWIGQQKAKPHKKTNKKYFFISGTILFLLLTGLYMEKPTVTDSVGTQKVNNNKLPVVNKYVQRPALKTQKQKKGVAPTNLKSARDKKATEKKEQLSVAINPHSNKTDTAIAISVQQHASKDELKTNAAFVFQQLDVSFSFDSSRSPGIADLYFTIHNRSAYKLNTVGLHVYYNDAAGALLQKETIYFSGLISGATKSAVAPSNEHARAVHYKLALIGMEDRIYYEKE